MEWVCAGDGDVFGFGFGFVRRDGDGDRRRWGRDEGRVEIGVCRRLGSWEDFHGNEAVWMRQWDLEEERRWVMPFY